MIFVLLLISCVLYIFAPNHYSYAYCCILGVIFLLASLKLVRYTKGNGNYFNFYTLFLFGFFLVNLAYPIFIFPVNPEYFPVFRFSFNYNVITKATALAVLGANSFIFGVIISRNAFPFNSSQIRPPDYHAVLRYLLMLMLILFSLIIAWGGQDLLTLRFMATGNIPPGLLSIFQTVVGLFIILTIFFSQQYDSYFKVISRIKKLGLIVLLAFIGIFLFSGDRGPVVQIMLISIGALSFFVKPINLKGFVILLVLSMFILTFVSYARSKGSGFYSSQNEKGFVERGIARTQVTSVLDLGMDLIINNRNLYVGYEYPQSNGYSYGKGMFYFLFAPIPYLPSIMSQVVFGSDPVDLNSATIITEEAGASYGLGTNMIADIYMQFGSIGVIIIMMLFGVIVRKCELRASKGQIYYVIAYLFLIGYSIYLPRTTILDPVRFIVWALILYSVFSRIRKAKTNIQHTSVQTGIRE